MDDSASPMPAADYMLTIFDTSNVRSWNNAYRDLSVLDDVTDLQLVAGPSVWIDGRVVREVANHFRSIRRRSRGSTDQQRVSLASTPLTVVRLADGTFIHAKWNGQDVSAGLAAATMVREVCSPRWRGRHRYGIRVGA